ncbi:uncharacterized protein KY384_005135 [Bacidia gigantensis]|uniref:uncharacterized protein n=1 Tax=Bacidia gigantensis TaxID=2732470 RepID=UPI001D0364C4|nr:uncharacterized protein KY384_005135 [Bacidia gigantensis]KAG8529654.1 hypothetical protein KY384_005135 [Bacidia gigantensis]
MEPLHTPPSPTEFTPLAAYESTTPSTFHPSQPILHHHSPSLTLRILRSDLLAAPILVTLVADAGVNGNGDGAGSLGGVNGGNSEIRGVGSEDVEIKDIEVYVTSENLIFWSRRKESGVRVRYESVVLHALQSLATGDGEGRQGQGLYIQLQLGEEMGGGGDGEEEFVEFVLVPPTQTRETGGQRNNSQTNGTSTDDDESEVRELFEAVGRCQELHPDPDPMDDEPDGGNGVGRGVVGGEGYGEGMGEAPRPYTVLGGQEGLPPPMPGSGGWITAENVGEWFDEGGQFRGGEGGGGGLGAGAGTIRTREDGGEGMGEENGDREREGDGETKWRRTDSWQLSC